MYKRASERWVASHPIYHIPLPPPPPPISIPASSINHHATAYLNTAYTNLRGFTWDSPAGGYSQHAHKAKEVLVALLCCGLQNIVYLLQARGQSAYNESTLDRAYGPEDLNKVICRCALLCHINFVSLSCSYLFMPTINTRHVSYTIGNIVTRVLYIYTEQTHTKLTNTFAYFIHTQYLYDQSI